MRTLLVAALSLGLPLAAHADFESYAGVGVNDGNLSLNFEAGNHLGNLQLRVTHYREANSKFAFSGSVRRYLEQDENVDGFFLGLYGGQVDVEAVKGDPYVRLGGGGEIGYQWVSPYTKMIVYGGLGAAEEIRQGEQVIAADPMFIVGVSVALGL